MTAAQRRRPAIARGRPRDSSRAAARAFRRAAVIALALAVNGPARAEPPARPRVGLALGGGGARGAAHIGVLEVLEQLHVPVDCVAGTSMGALVAGAWAAGLDPAEMRRQLARTDWGDLFVDASDYSDLAWRNRRLAQRFLSGTESGVNAGGVVYPPGAISGQKIKLFINELVHEDRGRRLIEQLALPLSIVATDIGTGERVVFRSGSLAEAMRASMSVPGLVAPAEVGGRRLVDGGLVDNLPVREVRERCRADVVVAVNVGTPLLKPEEVGSLLTVSAQVVNILTEQNVTQSRALLGPGDLYIVPELDGITSVDFARHAEAADRGRAAALAVRDALARLAVPERDYATWQTRRRGRERAVPRVDAIEVVGLERVDPAVVEQQIRQPLGEPLDTAQLDRDLLRIYGRGDFESVDYALLDSRSRHILRITPIEKPWGPDYLRLAINLDSQLEQGSTYSLRASYQRTWINRLGGELLFTGEVGSTSGLAAEWYQPLEAAQRSFVSTAAGWRRTHESVWFNDRRLATYTLNTATLDLAAGVNFGTVGQARVGRRQLSHSASVEAGIGLLSRLGDDSGGWLAEIDLDQLDRLYFPTRGWSAQAHLYDSSRRHYGRLDAEFRSAWSLASWVLGGRISYTGSPRGRLPAADTGRLGGFLNLSGYATGELSGDDIAYGHLRAERIIGRLPLGLRGDMRFGVALEGGRVRRPLLGRDTGWLDSATFYLGGETPIGPVYVGIGAATDGNHNAYLFLGAP